MNFGNWLTYSITSSFLRRLKFCSHTLSRFARSHPTFFNSNHGKARCLLVDSEPKVLLRVVIMCG